VELLIYKALSHDSLVDTACIIERAKIVRLNYQQMVEGFTITGIKHQIQREKEAGVSSVLSRSYHGKEWIIKNFDVLQVCGVYEELDANGNAGFHVRGIFFRAVD
jgi:hypothetical protein